MRVRFALEEMASAAAPGQAEPFCCCDKHRLKIFSTASILNVQHCLHLAENVPVHCGSVLQGVTAIIAEARGSWYYIVVLLSLLSSNINSTQKPDNRTMFYYIKVTRLVSKLIEKYPC